MSAWKRLLSTAILCCVPASAQQAGDQEAGRAGPYHVGPGDVLDVVVFEVDELSRPVTVGPGGTVELPLVGEVDVDGLTTQQIGARLEQLYGESLLRNPQISVAVQDYRSQPVSVFGAVGRPDIYQLQGRRKLLDVLAMAGGLAANVGEEVVIVRAREDGPGERRAMGPNDAIPKEAAPGINDVGREIRVSTRALLAGGSEAASNPWIEPHDAIRVSEAGVVYVLGAVGQPGGYPIGRETMSVLRALSLAQGLGRRAAPQKARVIRHDSGVRREIDIRIADVLRGREPDALLQDNDILFIPDSRAKSAFHRGAEAAIQVATGVLIWRR